jgi:signal transduction histidine kinase
MWGDDEITMLGAHPADTPLGPLESDDAIALRTGHTIARDGELSIRLLPLSAYGVSLGVLAVHAPDGSITSGDDVALAEVANLVAAAAHQDILVRALREQARTLEQRVADRTAALQSANAELEDFASVVAHDLRAPLRSVRGFSEALLEDYGDVLGDEGSDFARRIVAAARSGDTLVADLLAYSRIGRAEIAVVPVDLDGVADEVVQRLAAAIAESGASVVVDGWLGRALGARTLVVEALANLVENALKFVDGTPSVVIRAERHGTAVRLVVDDNGFGVPHEKREQIWRVFERLHPHAEYPGTGIGLAIVAKAAARMGGDVGIDDRPGGGSSIWLSLRALDPDTVAEQE